MAENTFVYNQDVRGIDSRIKRFMKELVHCTSSGLSETSEFDQERLQSYLGAITSYHNWVTGQPQLDLPESSPTQFSLDDFPEVPIIENESIRDVIVMMKTASIEITRSQSARRSSGLVQFDSFRLLAMVAKIQSFLDNYIKVATPLDLPESSPMREMSGPGQASI